MTSVRKSPSGRDELKHQNARRVSQLHPLRQFNLAHSKSLIVRVRPLGIRIDSSLCSNHRRSSCINVGIDSFLTSVGTCKIITTWQPKFALMCREVALRTSSERRAAPSDCVSDYSAAAWASRRLTGRRLLAFQRWSETKPRVRHTSM